MSPAEPTVSVIIPTYNRAGLVPRAVSSVLAQTSRDFELFVVDDGSTDETQNILQNFDDTRLRVLQHGVNRGGSAARNTGLDAARGRYVAFLDSDDEWKPEKLEKQLAVFERSEDPKLGVVLCGCEFLYMNRQHTVRPATRGHAFDPLLHRQAGLDGVPSIAALVLNDPEIRFDERLPSAQDWDFLLQYARKYTVDFVDDVLVVQHREHERPRIGTSVVSRAQGRKMMLHKYRAELATRPISQSRHHVRLAFTLVHLEKMREARRHLWLAARAHPKCLPCWIWWAASLLGHFPLRVAVRLFDHPSLHH